MKKFSFIQSFYFLPVFFFTLAGSPNIEGGRIGLVLVSVFILLIPSANYVAANPENRMSAVGDINYSLVDFLSLVMVIAAIYLGWQISWQFNLLQIFYLVTCVVFNSNRADHRPINIKWFITRASIGVILYALIYVGLNQYDFNNLFRIHIILFAFLSTLLIVNNLFISSLQSGYLLEKDNLGNLQKVQLKPIKQILILISILLLAFGSLFITTYNWIYAVYFAVALLPSYSIVIRLLRHVNTNDTRKTAVTLRNLNLVLAASLIVFFIYFFLDSTQVLQAILGGY